MFDSDGCIHIVSTVVGEPPHPNLHLLKSSVCISHFLSHGGFIYDHTQCCFVVLIPFQATLYLMIAGSSSKFTPVSLRHASHSQALRLVYTEGWSSYTQLACCQQPLLTLQFCHDLQYVKQYSRRRWTALLSDEYLCRQILISTQRHTSAVQEQLSQTLTVNDKIWLQSITFYFATVHLKGSPLWLNSM